MPVFKFCRAPLRAGWLRRVLPKAAFLYLNRNPDDLHRSYWSHGGATNYFSVQYAAVLLMFRRHPRWPSAAAGLLGPESDALPEAMDALAALHQAYRLCRDKGEQFSRDLTLLFWVHALLDNLRAGIDIHDYDQLVDDPRGLGTLLALCQSRLGLVPNLRPPRRTPQLDPGGEVVDPAFARGVAADLGPEGVAELLAAKERLHARSVQVLHALFASDPRQG